MLASLVLTGAAPLVAQVRLPAAPTPASQPAVPATAKSDLPTSQSALSQLAGQILATPAQANPPSAAAAKPVAASTPRITRGPLPPPPSASDSGGLQIPGTNGSGSVPWSVIVMLTALTLIPSILVCMTPFARLLIVFHFLRQALGLQTTPSNQTLIGLSLILTFFLMQPVASQIYQDAVVPMQSNQITGMEALTRAEGPMRHFMAHYVRDKDIALFVDLAKEPHPASMDDVSMRVLLPAYILSELKTGFQIGTVLFLPFLIVDMVVASITTSVGMLQLPPVVISTPLKLLLFLMVDGWHLLISSLMRSFQ
jgi:flagellar biosynthetic protein FliP